MELNGGFYRGEKGAPIRRDRGANHAPFQTNLIGVKRWSPRCHFWQRRKKQSTLTGGSRCQRKRWREEGNVLVSSGGPWAACGTGPNGSPGPLSYFLFFPSFSFSIFLISFISFAFVIQIDSN
jgi:hypothetical protein